MTYTYKYNTNLKKLAQANKRLSTDAELKLWHHLRGRRLGGNKFRRQYPVLNYILDFYCVEQKLCVELDGSQHREMLKHDTIRSQRLKAEGITVLRFWDNEVFTNIDGVLEEIRADLTSPQPSPKRRGSQIDGINHKPSTISH